MHAVDFLRLSGFNDEGCMEPTAFARCKTESQVVREVRDWLRALQADERDCLPRDCLHFLDDDEIDLAGLALSIAMARLDPGLAPASVAALGRLDVCLSAALTRVAWLHAYRHTFMTLPSARAGTPPR